MIPLSTIIIGALYLSDPSVLLTLSCMVLIHAIGVHVCMHKARRIIICSSLKEVLLIYPDASISISVFSKSTREYVCQMWDPHFGEVKIEGNLELSSSHLIINDFLEGYYKIIFLLEYCYS